MPTTSKTAEEKLQKFLHMLGRLKAPGLILVPPDRFDGLMASVKERFRGMSLQVWEVPVQATPDSLKDVFLQSFKKGGTLLAVVRPASERGVFRFIEEILEDGALDARRGAGWKPVKAPKDWSLLVIAEESESDPYITVGALFPHRLRI